MKSVFEAADARQKQAKKRSLCMINEHFESVFNTAAATQIVFQRPVRLKTACCMQMQTLFANIRQRTGIKREKIVQVIKSQAARGIFPFVLSLLKDLIRAS